MMMVNGGGLPFPSGDNSREWMAVLGRPVLPHIPAGLLPSAVDQFEYLQITVGLVQMLGVFVCLVVVGLTLSPLGFERQPNGPFTEY